MKPIALLVRLDRLGDLINTLPSDQHPVLHGFDIHWAIPEGLGPLVECAVPKRNFHEISLERSKGSKQLKTLIQKLNPKLSVVFYASPWVAWQIFKARIPLRIGRLSQWFSFLFYNRGVRQSRSQSLKHEADYNFQLVEASAAPAPQLKLESKSFNEVLQILKEPELANENFAVIHPGMRGSALNWPIESYRQLIRELVQQQKIIITGTRFDSEVLDQLREEFSQHANIVWAESLLSLEQMIALTAKAKFVIAPSTGVVHLAAAAGARVLCFFPPIQSQSAVRWGPRGDNVQIFVPEVECPAKMKCLEQACPHFPCMNLIKVQNVMQELSRC